MEDIILKIETEDETTTQKTLDPENILEINFNIYNQLNNPTLLNLTTEQIAFMKEEENCNSVEIKLNILKEIPDLINLVDTYFEYGWDEDEFLFEYMKVWIINEKTNEQLYFKEWKNCNFN
jgi:hypothetical protein